MSKVRIILLSTALISLALFLLFNSIKQKEGSSEQKVAIQLRQLSQKEYENTRDELLMLVVNHDPKIALSILREKISTDSAILRSCHVLTHEIGHKAFEKYRDFAQALIYKDEICNSGYLHGVIESQFLSSDDVSQTMKTICNKYPTGKFLSWECYHGIGHGLMYYTNNDLPKSISSCESLENDFAHLSCINGIFMENFNTDQKLHPSIYLDPKNPFYPCQIQKPNYKSDCYLYAPTYFLSLHNSDYSLALGWCKDAEKDYQQICAQGVGSQAIKENINNPKAVEKLCMQSDKDFFTPCIAGMVSLYINHYGSLEQARSLCLKLEKPNQLVCNQIVKNQESLFN